MSNTRTFKVLVDNKGRITRTTVSASTFAEAKELAERLYGGPGITVSILA